MVKKASQKEAEAEAKVRLEQVGLAHKFDAYPDQLSGGQQQRVAIARAIVIEPPLVLMDEPLSNLDATLRIEMREEILRIHQTLGLTTIYVTHDQDEALAMSDRIVVMREGEVAGELLHEQADERQALSLAMPKVSQAVA